MKLTPTYLDGALLAINALPGSGAVFDSHRCFLERTWVFDSLHDWSGGVAASGPYARDRRVFAPNWSGVRMATGTEDIVRHYVRLIAGRRPGNPVFLLRGTLSLLSATDLPGLAAELSEQHGITVIPVERELEDEDWIDGWRQVERSLWAGLLARQGERHPQFLGSWLLRREADETGNVAEIERLLRAAGVPRPVWPFSGRPFRFRRLSPAAPSLAFPYAGAADIDARSGTVLRVPLPVGMENTCRFLRALVPLGGRPEVVERFVARECRETRRRVRPFVANMLGGKGAVLVADPWLAAALASACRELNMGVALAVVLRHADAEDVDIESLRALGIDEILQDPHREEVARRLQDLAAARTCDIVVGAALLRDEAETCNLPYVEIGAPCRMEHFAASTPYMGFSGMVHLAQRLSNAIAQRDHINRIHDRAPAARSDRRPAGRR